MLEVKLPTSGGDLDDRKMDEILDGLRKAYNYVQDNSDVLEKLDGAKQIMNAVGEVSSIARSFDMFSDLTITRR